MLAEVHLDPRIGVPVALIVAVVLGGYWARLGREGVPSSRRRIRRWSIMVMLVSLPPFTAAVSFIDPEIRGPAYLVTWGVGLVFVAASVLFAFADIVNTLRLEKAARERVFLEGVLERHRAGAESDHGDAAGDGAR